MKLRFAKAFLIAGAVIANLALVATRAQAGEKDGWCSDGQGGSELCCKPCWIFCECSVVVE